MVKFLKSVVEKILRPVVTWGGFGQNLAISFSGNVTAQVIGFLFTPFLARVYGPEAYGTFALFLAIVNIISPLATMQYATGYVAIVSFEEFIKAVRLTLFTLLIFTAATVLVVTLFITDLNKVFGSLGFSIYAIPFYVFFIGLESILLGWSIRLKQFKYGAYGKVLSIFLSKGLALVLGYILSPGATGLILGNGLQYPIESLVKLSKKIKRELRNVFGHFRFNELSQTFIKLRAYPLYVTPGLLISNLSNQLPVYFFSGYFSQTIIGYFALASSIVTVPINLVITSSTTVFLQKAAEMHQTNPKGLATLVLRLYKRLFWIGLVLLSLISILSTWIFGILFGSAWHEAGSFASVLAIGFIFSLPALPLSVLFRVLNRERDNFVLSLFSVVLKFAGLWVGVVYNSALISIAGYSIASIVVHLMYLNVIFKMVSLHRYVLMKDFVIVLLISISIIYWNYYDGFF